MSEVMREVQIGAAKLRVVHGDLTQAGTEAIVNAANSELQHGGGVASAIVAAGGKIIQEESDKIGPVPEGEVAVTTAGKLDSMYVIHAVGPKGSDPQADEKLARAVRNALDEAYGLELASIAMPAISSGIFGFPKERCAEILLTTARDWLDKMMQTDLVQIDMVNIDEHTTQIFCKTFDRLFPHAAPGGPYAEPIVYEDDGQDFVLDGEGDEETRATVRDWLMGETLAEPLPIQVACSVNGYNRHEFGDAFLADTMKRLDTGQGEQLSTQELLDTLFLIHRMRRFTETGVGELSLMERFAAELMKHERAEVEEQEERIMLILRERAYARKPVNLLKRDDEWEDDDGY